MVWCVQTWGLCVNEVSGVYISSVLLHYNYIITVLFLLWLFNCISVENCAGGAVSDQWSAAASHQQVSNKGVWQSFHKGWSCVSSLIPPYSSIINPRSSEWNKRLWMSFKLERQGQLMIEDWGTINEGNLLTDMRILKFFHSPTYALHMTAQLLCILISATKPEDLGNH